MKNINDAKDGVVLVFVLAFTLAISAAVLLFWSKADRYTETFKDMNENFRLRYAAETGLEIGKKLLGGGRKSYDWLGDNWAEERNFHLDGCRINIKITDESGKINPNCVLEEKGQVNTKLLEVFQNLFAVTGLSVVLPASLLDWIDEDELPRSDGAEAFYYRSAKLPYQPTNKALKRPEEIVFIRGFTRDIVYGNEEEGTLPLINFITSCSDGKININTCPPVILNAIGFSIEQVNQLVEARENGPLEERGVININKEVFLKNKSILKFRSRYFSIAVTAEDENELKLKLKGYVEREKEVKTMRVEFL
jgi:type II secretory pathway component PulK